jgi:hypothetical protein
VENPNENSKFTGNYDNILNKAKKYNLLLSTEILIKNMKISKRLKLLFIKMVSN